MGKLQEGPQKILTVGITEFANSKMAGKVSFLQKKTVDCVQQG